MLNHSNTSPLENGQTSVHPCNGILLVTKKNRTNATHKNVKESQMLYAKGKETRLKRLHIE